MTTSQSLSFTLKNLLSGMADQGPLPMLPILTTFARREVSETEFLSLVRQAEANDPGVVQLRLVLAKWDASDNLSIKAPEGNETEPGSIDRRVAVILELGLSSETEAQLRELIPIHVNKPIVISKSFEPWYDEARYERSTMYWDDYERYLAEVQGWPATSIVTLDQATNEVIERLCDPVRIAAKQTKGLVVGYVQSGKTANFTGVIAKAIDAGYRLVIVMTGTIEILRSQTQRRIDMELVGVENVIGGQDLSDPDVVKGLDYQQDQDWIANRFVLHGDGLQQDGVARIRRVTTLGSDYKSHPQGTSQLRYERHDKKKPLNAPENLFATDAYVVVIKKHSASLRNLIKDLKPLQEMLLELPALVIDDESDQASVNTIDPKKSEKRTKINDLIANILKLAPRAQYIGYTATPFANVFVDPDDETNIFPSDFVLSLPRPENYMGVQEFHDIDQDWEEVPKTIHTSNELAHVRSLEADPESPSARREEMRAAIDAWVLSGVIKKYRESISGQEFRHHTMLIHESVKRVDQSSAADVAKELWTQGSFRTSEGLSRLRLLFDNDYRPIMEARADGAPIPASFDVLKQFVTDAFIEMTNAGETPVIIVNADENVQAQQQALNFETGKVWRILVGGTKLSRGFTVQGLTVSYYRRQAGQADTLMQAGRWFGFRQGYRDLVRLYIRRDSDADLYEAFEAMMLDEEAFRDELRKYQGFDEVGLPLVEPRQIPPLVSQHLPWLKPTARTKMFNAIVKSRAASGSFQQLSSVPGREDKVSHANNLDDVFLPLLAQATHPVRLPYHDSPDTGERFQPAFVGLVSNIDFLDAFDELRWHSSYFDVIKPLRAFFSTATHQALINDWAIIWPQRHKEGRLYRFDELDEAAPIFHRSRRRPPRFDFTGENKRNILAASPVAEGQNVESLGQSSTRGVVIISLVADREESSESLSVHRHEIVGLLSVRVPDASIRGRRGLIQYGVKVAGQAADVVVDNDKTEE